ncbi:hypothetical protein ISS37_05290 [candidate division KSB1 bacterium]|nr:hypothetical protein [candidate division KSB1 bacterium]
MTPSMLVEDIVILDYYIDTTGFPADDSPLSRSFGMAGRRHPPGAREPQIFVSSVDSCSKSFQ